MDVHNLKVRLQQHFSDGLVLVVGSGLSCAEGLPGMGELSEHLQEYVGGLPHEDEQLWARIRALLPLKGLEAALLETPPSAAIESAISRETAVLIAEREAAVISEVFSGRKLRLTRLIPHLLKPPSGLPIITTNYDRLVEIAVEEAGLGADTMFSGRFAAQLNERESRFSFVRSAALKKKTVSYTFAPHAVVYKPHGSLDWYLRDGKPVSYAGSIRDHRRLIITPGQNKFRNGYDSPFDQHRARANTAIDRASRFLVVGYGFNDDHLETHLTPAIRGGKPTLMLTRGLSRSAEAIGRSHPNVIALDRTEIDGTAGTRVILDKQEYYLPGVELWDLNNFVSEVLEP